MLTRVICLSSSQYLWIRATQWDGSPAKSNHSVGLSSSGNPNSDHPVAEGRGSHQQYGKQGAQVKNSTMCNTHKNTYTRHIFYKYMYVCSGSVEMAANSLYYELRLLTAASTPAWPPTLQEKRTGYLIWTCMVGSTQDSNITHIFGANILLYNGSCLPSPSAACDRRQQCGCWGARSSSGQFCEHRVRRNRLSPASAKLAEERPASASLLTHTSPLCWASASVRQQTVRGGWISFFWNMQMY